MAKMTIDDMIRESHTMAVTKGWWPDGANRSVAEQVNNFHAEISEAWEEYRHGRIRTWWRDPYNGEDSFSLIVGTKPEGFWVEISDLCIRIADTMGAYDWHERPWFLEAESSLTLPRMIGELHRSTDRLTIGCWGDNWSGDSRNTASSILHYCIENAKVKGIDLWSTINLKMAYNATRPERHGGMRA
jgi:hypothetical protein